MERVSIIEGSKPIIVVAPHGFNGDDENTALIAETISSTIDCYAVINRGWERADSVDWLKDKADCNNVYHCKEDVVREEFLEPIIRYKNKILQRDMIAYIIYIHGMGNRHRSIAKDPYLDAVIGYGAGKPSSYSCDMWQKNLLLHYLNSAGITTYEGKAGGQMSGWSRNNLNQYFRKWEYDPNVSSMQLEIIYDLRHDPDLAVITADYIANAILDMSNANGFDGKDVYRSY